jgi:hypothetical protein
MVFALLDGNLPSYSRFLAESAGTVPDSYMMAENHRQTSFV